MPASKEDHTFTNIGVADVAQNDGQFWITVTQLYRNFRRRALSEPGANAQGGWTLEQDAKRTDDSYFQEVTDPKFLMYVCMQTHGDHVPKSIEERRAALLEGEWVGFAWLYGPLKAEQWTLPTTRSVGDLGQSEYLFSGGGTYFVPEVRRVRDRNGETLAAALLKGVYDHVEDQIRQKTTNFPAHFRVHGNLTPDAIADGRILRYYRRHLGYVVMGFVPQVTNMITNNRVLPDDLPDVHQNPDFYAACRFAVVERHAELREDGSRVLLGVEEPTKKEKALL